MDPACPELINVRRAHKKQQRMVATSMETNPTLRAKFLHAESKDVKHHVESCGRCNTFYARNRCQVCGHGLIREVPGPRCSSGWHRFRIKMGWLPKPKPAAAAAPRPTPMPATPAAETRPPHPEPKSPPAPHRKAAPRAQPAPTSAPPATTAPTATPPPRASTPPSRPSTAHTTVPARHKVQPKPKPKKKSGPPKPHAHEVLGIPFDAPEATVRIAFREKAKSYHPDRVAHMGPEFKELAERHMRDLNAAYDTMLKRLKMKEKSA